MFAASFICIAQVSQRHSKCFEFSDTSIVRRFSLHTPFIFTLHINFVWILPFFIAALAFSSHMSTNLCCWLNVCVQPLMCIDKWTVWFVIYCWRADWMPDTFEIHTYKYIHIISRLRNQIIGFNTCIDASWLRSSHFAKIAAVTFRFFMPT